MFFKYIKSNLKKQPLNYLLLLLCAVVMLNILLCASGILVNSMTDKSAAKHTSRVFTVWFDEAIPAQELQEKVEQFGAEIPYKYIEIDLFLSFSQQKEFFYDTFQLYYYPDYEGMCDDFNETWDLSNGRLPNYQEYTNKEKVVLVGNGRAPLSEDEVTAYELVDEDGFLDVMGEKYKVVGDYPAAGGVFMLFGAQPKDTFLTGLQLRMVDPVTDEQNEVILSLYEKYFGDIPERLREVPEIYGLLELRADSANIGISAVLMFISTFNILLIFKYMLSSRKRGFAVFRFCGFGKATCVLYCGAEFMTLSATSAILSCVVFETFIRPALTERYTMFDVMFTADYYAVIIAAFLGISLIMFLIYIVPSLTKSVTADLRGI